MRARPPVPAALTTRHNPSRTAATLSGFIFTTSFGGGGATFIQP
jgi:hypothetical protein